MRGSLSNIVLGKQSLGGFFIFEKMEEVIKGFVKLADLIANELGLKIYYEIDAFASDGRDGLVNYVYDENRTKLKPEDQLFDIKKSDNAF